MSDSAIRKYCAFWIPSVAHNNFQIIEDIVAAEPIPGNHSSSYHLTSSIATIGANEFSVEVRVVERTRDEVESAYTVQMVSVDCCTSGLLEFEYALDAHYHARFRWLLPYVYRLVVHHFHRHVYHHPEKEGVKQPYVSDGYCPLNVEDNDVLVFYLRQIHALISQQVDMIHEMVPVGMDGSVAESEDDLGLKRQELERFYLRCENLRGQMPFFYSLLNSPFNRSCHVVVRDIGNELQKELHTIAHNIVNLNTSIQNLFERSKTAFYISNINTTFDVQAHIREIASANGKLIEEVQESNRISSRLGKISLWISVGMGVLSLLLGAVSVWLGVKALP